MWDINERGRALLLCTDMLESRAALSIDLSGCHMYNNKSNHSPKNAETTAL